MRRLRDLTGPRLLLIAHGTRDPAGPAVIDRVAEATTEALNAPVHVAYIDVIGPTVAEALEHLDGPVVAVPAFLASGYHVRTDLPQQLRECRRDGDVSTSPALGPAPELAEAMRERLTEAGWRRGQQVLFSAAGSSDERALTDVHRAAHLLGRRCGQGLRPSYVTTAAPLTAELCPRPAFVAPYLLAPGLFHRTLADLAVAGVAEPIGAHPRVIDLIVRRYREERHRPRAA